MIGLSNILNVKNEMNNIKRDKNGALLDFPKIHCPFIRQSFPIEQSDYRQFGRSLGLRSPEVYLVINKITPGYAWVFDDPDTFVCEKLDGSNTKLVTHKNVLVEVQNRKNIINPLALNGNTYYLEGILHSAKRGYIESDGEQVGELIGPKFQGNPYRLDYHMWYPFNKAIKSLRYKSFDKYDRTLSNWSNWFQYHIFSLFANNHCSLNIKPEGIIFYNLKRKYMGKIYMAKLRLDMFDWYYTHKFPIKYYDRDY